ncbi:MAG: hypothetical protein L6Q77_13150 [Bacteroidetes bacterium]|nr:hypothetical protein [Bacteroidota bacterium]
MRFVIPAHSEKIEDTPAELFARGDGFLIGDTESLTYFWIPNPYRNVSAHVGPDVVNLVLRLGAKRVYAVRFGPNVRKLLEKNGIEMVILPNKTECVACYLRQPEQPEEVRYTLCPVPVY